MINRILEHLKEHWFIYFGLTICVLYFIGVLHFLNIPSVQKWGNDQAVNSTKFDILIYILIFTNFLPTTFKTKK